MTAAADVLPIRATRIGAQSLVVSPRSIVVCACLAVGLVLVSLGSVLFGEIQVGLPRLLVTVQGDGSPFENYLILDSRLPRIASGLVLGAALAMSGAIFQTVSRNPLGSPDVIGFETGAATGGVIALIGFGAGIGGAAVGAVIGGLVTAAAVYLLAMRGGVDSMRLVLIGVGAGSILLSVNSLLIVNATIYDAQTAGTWLVGHVVGAVWSNVAFEAALLAPLGICALLLSRPLRLSELSDAHATTLGLATGRLRALAVLVGVLLSSVAVAAAGPIAFVALTAPQIARRLTHAAGPNLVASALTGALLLVMADHSAREAFPRQLPVGVVTGVTGGLFLAWLLSTEWRKGRA